MQGMLDKLSQPVAFATVPLGDAELYSNQSQIPPSSRREAGTGSDTDPDEPVLARLTRRIGINRDGRRGTQESTPDSSSYKGDEGLDDGIFDEGKSYIFAGLQQISKLTQIFQAASSLSHFISFRQERSFLQQTSSNRMHL
jgi:hypothetical protein